MSFPLIPTPARAEERPRKTYFVIRKLTQTPALPYTDSRWEPYQNFPVRAMAKAHRNEFFGFRRVEIEPRDGDSDVFGGKLECLEWCLFCHFYVMSLSEILLLFLYKYSSLRN